MPTILEQLQYIADQCDRVKAVALALKGEAPVEEPAPAPPASKFINGMSAPDELGRVELELVEKLRAEFGPAPNGYKIPSLWYVPGVVVSHLPQAAQGDYQMNVAGAAFNSSYAYAYKDERGFFGKVVRAKVAVIPHCLAWNGTLPALEAKLRDRIAVLQREPAYSPKPDTGALDTVAGYGALQSM